MEKRKYIIESASRFCKLNPKESTSKCSLSVVVVVTRNPEAGPNRQTAAHPPFPQHHRTAIFGVAMMIGAHGLGPHPPQALGSCYARAQTTLLHGPATAPPFHTLTPWGPAWARVLFAANVIVR